MLCLNGIPPFCSFCPYWGCRRKLGGLGTAGPDAGLPGRCLGEIPRLKITTLDSSLCPWRCSQTAWPKASPSLKPQLENTTRYSSTSLSCDFCRTIPPQYTSLCISLSVNTAYLYVLSAPGEGSQWIHSNDTPAVECFSPTEPLPDSAMLWNKSEISHCQNAQKETV